MKNAFGFVRHARFDLTGRLMRRPRWSRTRALFANASSLARAGAPRRDQNAARLTAAACASSLRIRNADAEGDAARAINAPRRATRCIDWAEASVSNPGR